MLIEGDSLKSFEVDDPSTLRSRQQSDLPYLFGEGTDLRILEDTTIEDVELELRNNCNFTWALDLTLISLDVELPSDIRKEAVDSLEKLLEMKETLVQVENVLYAHPLPEGADLKGALELSNSPDSSPVHKFLLELEEFQPRISEVCRAFESIPTEIFGNYEDKKAFRSVAVSERFFHVLATEPPRSGLIAFRIMTSSSIRELPNHATVLGKWHDLSHASDDLKSGNKVVRLKINRPRGQASRVDLINRGMLIKALRRTHGNQVRAAKLLGISLRELRRLLFKSRHERRNLTV